MEAVKPVHVTVETLSDKEAREEEALLPEVQRYPAQLREKVGADSRMAEDPPRAIAYMAGHCLYRDQCGSDLSFFEFLQLESVELTQFAALLFDESGDLKPEYIEHEHDKGSGCFGEEVNGGRLFYLDTVHVNSEYRYQGIGLWMLEQFLQSEHVDMADFVMLWPYPADGDSQGLTSAQLNDHTRRLEVFFRKAGFRRIGRTPIFAYAKDPNHPSRKLPASEDADSDFYKRSDPMS